MTKALQEISIRPAKSGTAIVTVSLVDDAKNSLIFAQLTNPQWQLMTIDGKALVGYTYSDSSLTALSWALYGSALAMYGPDDTGERILTFKATYDSTYGNNFPLYVSCTFFIQDIAGIAYESVGVVSDLLINNVKSSSVSGPGGI